MDTCAHIVGRDTGPEVPPSRNATIEPMSDAPSQQNVPASDPSRRSSARNDRSPHEPSSPPARFRAPETESTPKDRTVFRPSPMAYGGVLILALACLSPAYYAPAWGWLFFLLPLAFGWWVYRSRTQVDHSGVQTRTWRSSSHHPWAEISGLVFAKRGGAQLKLTDESLVPLPAVGFNDLPRLAEASGGRIPDPFDAPRAATAE